jgi:ferredoxin
MPSCEKCWDDSFTLTYMTGEDRVECYQRLIKERNCTPEEQAGHDAKKCPQCGRMTLHQYTGDCMNPKCGIATKPKEE